MKETLCAPRDRLCPLRSQCGNPAGPLAIGPTRRAVVQPRTLDPHMRERVGV